MLYFYTKIFSFQFCGHTSDNTGCNTLPKSSIHRCIYSYLSHSTASSCYLRRRILLTISLAMLSFQQQPQSHNSTVIQLKIPISPSFWDTVFFAFHSSLRKKHDHWTDCQTHIFLNAPLQPLPFYLPFLCFVFSIFFCTQRAVLITCSNPCEIIYHLEILL